MILFLSVHNNYLFIYIYILWTRFKRHDLKTLTKLIVSDAEMASDIYMCIIRRLIRRFIKLNLSLMFKQGFHRIP